MKVWRIVASITIVQPPRLQVKHANEQRNEHTVVVAITDVHVHRLHNMLRLICMGRDIAEERTADCHHQRGWHAFARHVADAEIQFLVADEEVVEVTAHSFGRCQRSIEFNVLTVGEGGERLG